MGPWKPEHGCWLTGLEGRGGNLNAGGHSEALSMGPAFLERPMAGQAGCGR